MKTVAILYKNTMTRVIVKEYLDSLYRTVSFNSIGALKKDIKYCRPHIIICEASERGLDARELFPNISERYPIVFISAIKKLDERRKCLLQDKHHYLSVPYYPEDLQSALGLLLRESQDLCSCTNSRH